MNKLTNHAWSMGLPFFPRLKLFAIFLACIFFIRPAHSQPSYSHSGERNLINLNGRWQIIIDPTDAGAGNWKPVWKDQHPSGKYDFYEYGFTGSNLLNVPGDWNSQKRELTYYEGTIWYKTSFSLEKKKGRKYFLYFGAVNYACELYVNHERVGAHEGGFTSFRFDITSLTREGVNTVILRVNNQRRVDGIPALHYDWWNYGGITREVWVQETPAAYISDYFIQLKRGNAYILEGWVQVMGSPAGQPVSLEIPDLAVHFTGITDSTGRMLFQAEVSPQLWSPERPYLYRILIHSLTDSVRDEVGFRNIEVQGTEILLNDKPIFLRGVNIHEEIPQRAARAWSREDAKVLLGWAKALGCNFVRLTHYPHSEYMVRLADEMGILLWEEIPLWQNIQFANPAILPKADTMLSEMISRDKNRCAIIIWSLSNETTPGPDRNRVLEGMAAFARKLDPTRLIASAINHVRYEGDQVTIDDSLCTAIDVVGVNEYLGWYQPWNSTPEAVNWSCSYNKPLIMTEFGGEALYGRHGAPDRNGFWYEERQEQLYKEQLVMLKRIPFLRGTCPWVLADFRSESRMHPVYQQGWNRKGLMSNQGLKKKAWYVMHDFYTRMQRHSPKPSSN